MASLWHTQIASMTTPEILKEKEIHASFGAVPPTKIRS